MASISVRKDFEGRVVSFRIRVSRGTGVAPYERTFPDRSKGECIPTTWSYYTALKEANRVAAAFEAECRKGNVTKARKTFGEYALYVLTLKEETGLKHSTANRYRAMLCRINDIKACGFGHIKVQDVRADHLNRLYHKLAERGQNQKSGGGLAVKTIIEHHRFISSVFSQAVKEGLIPTNTAQRATPPKMPRHEASCFELETVQDILRAAEGEDLEHKTLIHLFVNTGARRGEIMGLKWESVNFETGELHLCNNLLYSPQRGVYSTTLKTGESRTVHVGREVVDLLRALQLEKIERQLKMGAQWKNTGYIFTQWDGAPMHPDTPTRYLKKFAKRYGLPPINPHKFRHTQASLLINAGLDIVSVSKRLGHAKVSTTTDIYAHILNNSDAKASATIGALVYQKQA